MPPAQYLRLLFEEIRQLQAAYPKGVVSTVYFGGGTPSLLPAEDIVSILAELAKHGFATGPQTEITIEINPATIQESKMELYLKAGINRFSVGAQTFDDALLKSVHREHNAEQTRDTLRLLKKYDVNFSFDILFALPGQTTDGLRKDLDEVLKFQPNHVSPYCLTVPEGHVLSKGRPLEEDQLTMFDMIAETLQKNSYERYEISNFARKGYESKHNYLYWDGSQYWGLGLSSHSYDPHAKSGRRYWNPNSIGAYQDLIQKNSSHNFDQTAGNLTEDLKEDLKLHQAWTDFCHTRLRTTQGLSESQLSAKFGAKAFTAVAGQLSTFEEQGLVTRQAMTGNSAFWQLTDQGILLSNQVFAGLTYLEGELPS